MTNYRLKELNTNTDELKQETDDDN